mmetsp:Transcript_8633/g.18906  ORF Transcript_8633/g.18906 Transcript_8633/m.18906 type:complete len:226 (-) Transcript_8633:219-896(-)
MTICRHARSLHGRRSLDLKLRLIAVRDGIPVESLELVAKTARLRASLRHKRGVLLTLTAHGPLRAVRLLVLADARTHAARGGALVEHVRRVVVALGVEAPDGARLLVLLVRTLLCRIEPGRAELHLDLAGAAREGAELAGVAGVVDAFARRGPAGAVVMEVLARALAQAARYGAVEVHVLGVFSALALAGPVVAVGVHIRTLGRTDAARGGAVPEHMVRVGLALA